MSTTKIPTPSSTSKLYARHSTFYTCYSMLAVAEFNYTLEPCGPSNIRQEEQYSKSVHYIEMSQIGHCCSKKTISDIRNNWSVVNATNMMMTVELWIAKSWSQDEFFNAVSEDSRIPSSRQDSTTDPIWKKRSSQNVRVIRLASNTTKIFDAFWSYSWHRFSTCEINRICQKTEELLM